jgi:molybdenum cofactor guanylyltransferase
MNCRNNIANITGIILAGGSSLRLGYNKLFLKMGDRYLIDIVIDSLSQFTSSLLIVTREDQMDLIKSHICSENVVADLFPGKGPLGGIYTGLANAPNTYSFIVGCDMPFINSALAGYIINNAHDYDAILPKIGNMIEPLHAIYSRNCLSKIECLLQMERLSIAQLFPMVRTRYIDEHEINALDPNHLSFININTKRDLTIANLLLGK